MLLLRRCIGGGGQMKLKLINRLCYRSWPALNPKCSLEVSELVCTWTNTIAICTSNQRFNFTKTSMNHTGQSLNELVEVQSSKVKSNPNDYHLKFDLVILSLRLLYEFESKDWFEILRLIDIVHSNLEILSGSPRFAKNLKLHLLQDLTERERNTISIRLKELLTNIRKNLQVEIRLYTAVTYHFMLSGMVRDAHAIAKKMRDYVYCNCTFIEATELHFKEEKYEMAVKKYLAVLDVDRRHSGAWTNLGILEYRNCVSTNCVGNVKSKLVESLEVDSAFKSHLNAAVVCFEYAIEYDVDNMNIWCHYHYAHVCENFLNEPSIAREHYAKVLQINPSHFESLTALGSLLMDEKQYEDALKCYLKAKSVVPNKILVYYNLGSCYSHMGMIEYAVRELHKAIELDPKQPLSHVLMANALFRQEDYKNSLKGYEKALMLVNRSSDHGVDVDLIKQKMFHIHEQLAWKLIRNGSSYNEFYEAGIHLKYLVDNPLSDLENIHIAFYQVELGYCQMRCRRIGEALDSFQKCEKMSHDFFKTFKETKSGDHNPKKVFLRLNKNVQLIQRLTDDISRCSNAKTRDTLIGKLANIHYDLAFYFYFLGELNDTIYNLSRAYKLDTQCISRFSFQPDAKLVPVETPDSKPRKRPKKKEILPMEHSHVDMFIENPSLMQFPNMAYDGVDLQDDTINEEFDPETVIEQYNEMKKRFTEFNTIQAENLMEIEKKIIEKYRIKSEGPTKRVPEIVLGPIPTPRNEEEAKSLEIIKKFVDDFCKKHKIDEERLLYEPIFKSEKIGNSIRKAKTKRRKKLKYSILASKQVHRSQEN